MSPCTHFFTVKAVVDTRRFLCVRMLSISWRALRYSGDACAAQDRGRGSSLCNEDAPKGDDGMKSSIATDH